MSLLQTLNSLFLFLVRFDYRQELLQLGSVIPRIEAGGVDLDPGGEVHFEAGDLFRGERQSWSVAHSGAFASARQQHGAGLVQNKERPVKGILARGPQL